MGNDTSRLQQLTYDTNIDEKVNFNEQDFNTLKSLMSRRNKPLKFPLGHFVRYLYKGKFRDQVEEEEKEKQEEDLKNVYIEKRFYNIVEIGFIFWFLIFRKDFTLAKLLAENERQYIEPFLDKVAKIIGVKKIKLLLNKSLSKMVSYPQGLKWGLLEAIKYKMDQFATEQLEVYEFLKSDKEFMLEMKELSAKFKCIRMLQFMYKDFFSPSYQLNFYEEITTKLSSGDTKKYVKKDDAEVKEDNIQILEVFHQKIKKYEIKIKNEHQKYKSYESNREINMTTSSGEEDYQEKELQKIRKNIEDYQNERDQLEQEMKYIISTPYYLENVNLTSELIKYQAYYVIPHLFRERIKVRECIEDHQIFIDDFKMILNLWDKFSFYVIYEISLKLLEKEENILALYPPDSQKNIVKLILTRVYIGSELLSRIKIQKWNQKFNKDLLSAIEQHCKDPNHIIYCQKPMLAICLLIEFIEKLMQNTKQQRNKCIAISQQLLNIGGKFVKELKDAEMVKFFSSQKDSRGRSALVIMSIKHFYTMLESPQMALIIKEQWHGPSSQCFGTQEMCSTYKISMSLYGYDEARRRFNSVLFDKKSYQFQYYIWPDSCSARYNIYAFFILILAFLYVIVINLGIDMDIFENLQKDITLDILYKIIMVWICTIFIGDLMEIIFNMLTQRKTQLDLNKILDILLLVGIIIQYIDVPLIVRDVVFNRNNEFTSLNQSKNIKAILELLEEEKFIKFSQEFNIFLNSIMCLIVWLKITNFVLAIQQFGIYVRMFRHMLVVLINFMILFFLWVACASLIFTAMFYNDSLEFQSYFQSFLNLYNGGLTNFDNKVLFDNQSRNKWWGSLFYIAYISITAVFLLNMIVAILTNVYTRVFQKIDADHNAYLVVAHQKLKFDQRYGLLIFSQPPFNILSFIFMPILIIMHFNSKFKEIKKVNQTLCKILHFPNAVLLFIELLVVEIVFFPIALIKGLILYTQRGSNLYHSTRLFFTWLFFGAFILLKLVLFDIFKFWVILYKKPESMKKRTNRMFTKQELKEQQREEDFKENKNMDNKQRFNLFIEREELRIFSKTLKYYNDYFINKDKTEQVVSSTTEKLVNIKEKFMKQWEQIRKIDKQNLVYKKQQEIINKKMKKESQRQVLGLHQSKTSQYYFSNEASHEQALLIDKQIDKEPRKPAIKVQAVVGKLTYFKDPANQPEMSKKIVRITENFMNVMSINKQTMEEFILWLSNIENFLDIDKMRKVIYDEQIIEDMNDQDFEEYRQRLFNTKTTFFDKAIEKSSKKITNDFAEIQYANDIASNLEDINTQFKYLKKKMTRIFIFMQLVKPDGLQFKEDLFGSHDEKSHVRAASEIISKHASELRRQKRKKREAKDKEDQNNKFFEYEKQKLQLTNPYSIRL